MNILGGRATLKILMMKKIQLVTLFLVLVSVLYVSSCQVVGEIFKAGVWSGVLLVVLGIGFVIFLIAKISGGR
jgi:cytosine/uracil/thiamine/allantoin permease